MNRRKAPKPFSEKTVDEQVREARDSIERLRHPHNYGNANCYAAVRRWEDFLRSKGVQP